MGSAGRRVRPVSASDLISWLQAMGRSQWVAVAQQQAARAEQSWGLGGLVAGTNEQPVGLLVLGRQSRSDGHGPEGPAGRGTAALLGGVFVQPTHRRQGIGRQLVQAAGAELLKRNVAALEALANAETLPAAFLQAVGFHPIGGSPGISVTLAGSRYRMDLTSTVRWRPDLAAAWHRISGLVPPGLTAPLPPPQPAGFEPSRRVGEPGS